MTKLSLSLATLAAAGLVVAGCGGVRSPLAGCIYTDIKGSSEVVTMHVGASKVGESMATGILGWIATGDCSTKAAISKGGITKINFFDYHSTSILGLYCTYTTVVYGE